MGVRAEEGSAQSCQENKVRPVKVPSRPGPMDDVVILAEVCLCACLCLYVCMHVCGVWHMCICVWIFGCESKQKNRWWLYMDWSRGRILFKMRHNRNILHNDNRILQRCRNCWCHKYGSHLKVRRGWGGWGMGRT